MEVMASLKRATKMDIMNKVRQFKTENPECEGCKPIFEALDGCASYNEIHFALRCL